MPPSKVADRATLNSNTGATTHDYALTGLTVGNLLIIRTAADNAGGGGAAVTVTVTNQSGTPISTSTDLAYQQNCDPGAASAGTTCNVILAEITATSGTVRLTYGASVRQAGVAEEWTGLVAIASIIVQTPFGGARTTANTATATGTLNGIVSGNLCYNTCAVEGPASDTYTQDPDTTNGSWSDLTKAGGSDATADLNQTTWGGYKIVTGTGNQAHAGTISTARESATLILELAAASGDATATPATIARSFTLPAPTATGEINATATPSVIARSFTVATASASAGSTATPVVIARSFTLPKPDTWDPSDISGFVCWFDAATGTNTQVDGASVLAWSPRSSIGGIQFLQLTGTNQPTYKTNIINGYPVLRFDGTTDFMKTAINPDASMTIFLVAKRGVGGSTTRTALSLDPDNGQTTTAAVYNTATDSTWMYTTPSSAFDGSDPDRWEVLTLKYNSTSSLALYHDGYDQAPDVNPNDSYQSGTTVTYRIGAGTDTTDFFSGDIAELIVYSAAVATADRSLVEQYLLAKYGQWSVVGLMGRFDDDTETAATEIGAPFTTASGILATELWAEQDQWHPVRARFEIQAGPTALTLTPRLQYRNPVVSPKPWADVDTTTTNIRVYQSEYVTDGTATTNIMSAGTGSFIAGTVETSAGTASAVSLAAGEHTEIEWCFVNAQTGIDKHVELRVVDDTNTGYIRTGLGIKNGVGCEGQSYINDDYRGREDDGTETTATWKAATSTDWDQAPDETFRVRFAFHVFHTHPSWRALFRLQYRLNAGAWDYVTTSSNVVRSVTSTNFTDEDVTTQQLSGTATFRAGRMDEDGVASEDWSMEWPEVSQLTPNRTELEYALQIVGTDVADTDTIELRVTNYREPFSSYTTTPTITVTAGGADGTATPSTIARSFTVETAGATGGGTVAPATIARSFTVSTATATGGGTATPAVIARPFTVTVATATGAGTATPATIARVFLQPTPSVSTGSTLTPATIARSFAEPVPSLSAGSTVTAPLIARDLLLPAPAATGGGSATATPAVIAQAFTLPAPTTSSGSTASPAVIARSIALPAPTVSGGTGATAAPAVIAGAFVVVAPAVSVGSTLAPATIARSFLVPAPAASGGGSASVAPAVITGAFTLPAPTVTAGGSVAPAVTALSALLSAPTISGGGTATPATIVRSIGVPNPSASGSSAGTAAPATIARSFTQPAPSLSTGSSTTPATIARNFLVPAATATGGTAATPATIARSFLQPTPALSYGSTLTVTTIARSFALPAPSSTGGGTTAPAVIDRQFALPAPTVSGGGTAFPATIVLLILLPTVGAQGSIYPDLAPFVRAYVLDARRAYRLTAARSYTLTGTRIYRR